MINVERRIHVATKVVAYKVRDWNSPKKENSETSWDVHVTLNTLACPCSHPPLLSLSLSLSPSIPSPAPPSLSSPPLPSSLLPPPLPQSPCTLNSVVFFDTLTPDFTIDSVALAAGREGQQKAVGGTRASQGTGLQLQRLLNPAEKIYVKVD